MDKIAATRLHVRDAAGKVAALEWKKGEHAYLVSLPEKGPALVGGVCQYGVLQRGQGKPFLLAYYPKLVVGVPFTPATAPRLLVRPGADAAQVRNALVDEIQSFAESRGFSSVHGLFVTNEDSRAFVDAGWIPRSDVQFHWANQGYRDFEHFLEGFTSKARKNVLRERRRLAENGLACDTLLGPEISRRDLDQVYDLPYSVVDSESLGRIDFAGATAIVLPDGNAPKEKPAQDALKKFMREGGVVVALGSAAFDLASSDKAKEDEKGKEAAVAFSAVKAGSPKRDPCSTLWRPRRRSRSTILTSPVSPKAPP